MTIRYYLLLLCTVAFVMLSACGTTSPRPTTVPVVEPELPAVVETVDLRRIEDIQRDPSLRSLTETIDFSKSMSGYQAGVALEILRSLESLSSSQLTTMIDGQQYDPEFTEWLELALESRSILISDRPINLAAREWADYHYGHVVTRENFPELINLYRDQYPVPYNVAVLLPDHGGLAAAAKAIRDGILSAYIENPDKSVIRFYSSGENGESALQAYQQARLDGATQIIGPLRIESTRSLAGLDDLSVPVLLLNEAMGGDTPMSGRPDMVNSLTLSQSEEAVAIANRTLKHGLSQAIILAPDSAWGKRIESAFSTVFENGDGHIAATAHFDTATSDHSAVLTQLLKIDESRQRKAQLQSRLGAPLTFEPHRRDDFDFIFMAANPSEGRELKPLLRFHDAGDIPVFAMGRIYSGKVERASDQDLNGVLFPTTPWQLQAGNSSALALDSVRDGAFGNLFALGQDAWHILRWLPLLRKDPDLSYPGDTGTLRLQENGHLRRQPTWAEFSAGRPVAYQWPES